MSIIVLSFSCSNQKDAISPICPYTENLSCNNKNCQVLNISEEFFRTYLPNKGGFKFESATVTFSNNSIEIFTVEKNSKGQSWECTYPDNYCKQYFPVLYEKIMKFYSCKNDDI